MSNEIENGENTFTIEGTVIDAASLQITNFNKW